MPTPVDVVIIVVYLVAMIAIGIATRGRQQSTSDYFTAGGGMSGFFGSILVGLSLAATLFSGISFLSYPSVIYSTGLTLLTGVVLVSMPIAWLVLRWFLPRYLAMGFTQPYDVLRVRIGPHTRTTAAGMFILMRIGWMAALIYAPTLAIMATTGLSERWFWPLVLIIGLSSTLYTALGGIRGVIVTDAIQFCVIALGIVLTIGYVLWNLPIPLKQAAQELADSGHLRFADWHFDMRRPITIWSVVIGVSVANLANYIGDQMSLQRYLATGSAASALRSFTINVLGVVVVLILLAGVGLALRAWYTHNLDPNLPAETDKIFPYFLGAALPQGITGIMLAAILAATMSSMTSGINTLSATLIYDFRRLLHIPDDPRWQLWNARLFSLVIGLLSTLAAGLVRGLNENLFGMIQIILGVFAGPLLACVLLAVSGSRLRDAAMVLAMIAGALSGVGVIVSPWASLWVAPVTATVTALFAVSGSLVGHVDEAVEVQE
ncbi:MAG: hypothetical protein IT445_10240 [Phycisphaeraceae bacterium]|nr:hypothetical protein [Phycisphaeraceae bacterium]